MRRAGCRSAARRRRRHSPPPRTTCSPGVTCCGATMCRLRERGSPEIRCVRCLAVDDELAQRRAVRSFRVAYTTGRGFDNGVTRTTRRSIAEVRLADVAAHGSAAAASQAGNLLGVLVVARWPRHRRSRRRRPGTLDASRRRSGAIPRTLQPSTTSSCCCGARVRRRRGRGRAAAPGRWGEGNAVRAQGRRGGGTDVLASLTFLSPRGGLLALVALVPLAVLAVSTLRIERIARALRLPPASRRAAVVPAALVDSCLHLHRDCRGAARLEQHGAPSSPHGVPGLLRRRRVAFHGGRREPIRPAAPGACSRRGRPAPGRCACRARRRRRPHRPGPAVPLPDARRAGVRGNGGPLRPDRVAAAAAGQHERDELRRPCLTRARRLLQPLRGPADMRPRHRRREPLVLAGRRGRRARRAARLPICWSCESAIPPSGSSAPTGRRKPPTPPTPQRPTRRAALAEAAGGEAFSEDDLGAAAAALERAADVGPVGRQRTGASELPSPRTRLRLLWQPFSSCSACGSGESGCTGSSRKRKLLRCGLAGTPSSLR